MTDITTDAWDEAEGAEDVSVDELDAALKDYVEKREDYEAKKKASNEADKVQKTAQAKLLTLLNASNKKNWEVEGFGKVGKVVKYSIKVPEDLGKKKEMLQHFRSLGPDIYIAKVSVNSNTLNAYYNAEKENDPNFEIPGCDAPIANETLSLRNRRKVEN